MAIQIQNNKDGTLASVSSENQLRVVSENHKLEHHVSFNLGDCYRVLTVDTGITAETTTLLHIKNTSTTKLLVVASLEVQLVTDTASKPVVGEYIEVGYDETLTSGGTTESAINMNRASGKVASVVATGVDPTMGGTFVPTQRRYHKASGDWHEFGQMNDIVLGLNDTFSVKVTSGGAGEATASLMFCMVPADRDN